MDDETGGLFAINLSDSELDSPDPPKPARRIDQTEDEFQAVRATFSAKVENGNIYNQVKLPLASDFNKQHIQQIIHAVEELYFFKRFKEGVEFAERVLLDKEIDEDTRALLRSYRTRCEEKLR